MRAPAPGLAIVAGRGLLPRLIAEDCARTGRRYRVVVFEGLALDWVGTHPTIAAAFEKPGRLFADLREANCGEVTFAGGMARPSLSPRRFDLTMLRLAPKLLGGLKGGDDSTLRLVAGIVEAEGLRIVAPHELLRDLLCPAGVLGRVQPSEADRRDAERAARLVAALGRSDAGQGAVVAQGLCLGLESIQGTDAMLSFVAGTAAGFRPDPAGARGVLFKGPKPGQDWRLDLPAVGPETIRRAQAARLGGVCLASGGVLVLGLEETIRAADEAGLALWARPAAAP